MAFGKTEGEVAEWIKAAVLKTATLRVVGSNPTLSAMGRYPSSAEGGGL